MRNNVRIEAVQLEDRLWQVNMEMGGADYHSRGRTLPDALLHMAAYLKREARYAENAKRTESVNDPVNGVSEQPGNGD